MDVRRPAEGRGFWARKWLLAVVAAGAVAAWPGACARNRAPQQTEAATPEHVKFDYTLKDMSGKDVRLADYAGKPLLINFWATWCGPCKDEIPVLVALSEQYKDRGLTVLGVSIDDSPEDLRKFAAEYKMTYPILVGLGHDDMLEEYEATFAVPVSWFIKSDGKVLIKHEGGASHDWFEQQIKALF